MIEYRNLRVALLGAGSVGSQVARLLLEQGDELASRVGASLELVGIAVRDVDAARDVELPRELYTTDASSLILGADIVVELMGGIEPARGYVLQALNSGADVITANKALLATHGPELFEAAEQVGAQLYYEAAVGGAIPIIRPLRDSLAGDRVNRILGIVNGTTNFVLDRMDVNGESLEDALATATERGYAEADPTADIGGYDAAQKAAILASLAFHTTVPLESVSTPRARPAWSSSCSPSANGSPTARPASKGSRRASIRPSSVGTTRWPRFTVRTTRCSCSRRPPAISCSTEQEPGEWRPRPLCSATSSRPRVATSSAVLVSRSPLTRSCPSSMSVG
jgi:homoserine dehydrogenase